MREWGFEVGFGFGFGFEWGGFGFDFAFECGWLWGRRWVCEEEWEGLREMGWEGTQPIFLNFFLWFVYWWGFEVNGWRVGSDGDGDGGVGEGSVGFIGSVLGSCLR